MVGVSQILKLWGIDCLLLSGARNDDLSQLNTTATSSRSFINETSQFHYFPSLSNNRRSDFRENDSSVRDWGVSWRAAATTEGFLEDCCVIAINSTDAWPLAGESREIFIEVAEVGQTVSWAQLCLRTAPHRLLLPLPLYFFTFFKCKIQVNYLKKVKLRPFYCWDSPLYHFTSGPTVLHAIPKYCSGQSDRKNGFELCSLCVLCSTVDMCIIFRC